MNKFQQILTEKKLIIGDGAMGTSLQKEGLSAGEAPEKLNLEQPEIIKKVHKSFVTAGADLLETNTFGGNPIRLAEAGLEDRTAEINQRAVSLAREVAGEDIIIAGSVGPTGKMFSPLGELTAEQAFSAYQEQISNLVAGGVDVILIETITDLKEMEQALKAGADFSCPVIAQMNFNAGGKTVMGASIEDFVKLGEENDVSVLGTNCTEGVGVSVELIEIFAQQTELPLSVFPNAGQPEIKDGEVYYPQTENDYVSRVEKFISLGVKIFGGCCGSTPEIISAMADKVKQI